ncbi:MAG: hypothetical protein ACK5ZY_07415 [Cyclobacteriaceae bacterium]|jgi:hypothetical protein
MELPKHIRIPLYKMYYITNVKEEKFIDANFIKSFKKDYTLVQQNEILSSLKWALENPNYDFKSLLPGLKHTNDDILYYFKCVYDTLLGKESQA